MGMFDSITIEHPEVVKEFGLLHDLQTKSLDRFMDRYVIDCFGMLVKQPNIRYNNFSFPGFKIDKKRKNDITISDMEFIDYTGSIIAYGTNDQDQEVNIDLVMIRGFLNNFHRLSSRVDLFDYAMIEDLE